MAVIPSGLIARDTINTPSITPSTINLLIALVLILSLLVSMTGCLLIFRSRQRLRQLQRLSDCPSQECPSTSKGSYHRRLKITASPYGRYSNPVPACGEKQFLMEDPPSPTSPTVPVPEIRITFPEENDGSGKRVEGRMVTVRIGDKGAVGLEPCIDAHLPPYQNPGTEKFQSLDLERIGGLREKV